MKKLKSLALPAALSGMLMPPAIACAADGSPASEPALGSAIGQVTPGFYWCKGRQSYRYLGDNKTWLYLESCQRSGAAPVWVWCNDDECEKTMISAAASGHWFGISFKTQTSFDSVRLYKY